MLLFGFMLGYSSRLTNILEYSLSQIYLEVSIPNFGRMVHILLQICHGFF